MSHELAGKVALKELLIDVAALEKAYYEIVPQSTNKNQRVAFGTSGHRGKAMEGSFNELHVAAIAQAICDGRHQFGAEGTCYVGQDTHALSQPAYKTVLEVLAGNGVMAGIDKEGDFVPTPSMSRAILRENEKGTHKVDGIIITPSHNPPDNGGIKYNPPHGGPAEKEITSWIEARANEYIEKGGQGIKKMAFDSIPPYIQERYEFKKLYVKELTQIIDMEAIQKAQPKVLVDALGGSGGAYWVAIKKAYQLDLEVIHSEYDPTFSFMRCDHDGQIRMDCSSPYAMAGVIEAIGDYDLAVGNDPDYDRYGVVTPDGMMGANDFYTTASQYLFAHRDWKDKGIAKSIVVTELLNRMAKAEGIDIYEMPVGFKFFSKLLFEGKVGIAGEESAGGSFLTKDGKVWTTDKDGIIMALLAMEMFSVMGESPTKMYEKITAVYGRPYFGRYEAPCTNEEKALLKALDTSRVMRKELNGEAIVDVRTKSLFEEQPIEGLYVRTEMGWVVARPSGTEPLYKIYGESFKGEEDLQKLLEAGQELVSEALR